MKHSPSLIERAAELYDFRSVFGPPQPAAAQPQPAPKPQPAPEPQPSAAPRVQAAPSAPVEAERPARPISAAPRPQQRRATGGEQIDRVALKQAGYIVPEGAVTGLAEEIRLVKRQLLAGIERRVSLPEDKRRSVLISSAQPGEGKSFFAINLALSLAGERDVEVLLVDGDFAKPEALATLGLEDGPGLVDALADPSADPESFVIRTDVPGLSVLPAGRKANNVPELLASDRTREVLAKLVAGDPRRIILFDSPPVLMASPATVLSGHVGQTLVVVRADRTTEADLRETIGLLSGCDHVGLILNGAGLAVTGRKFGAYNGYGNGK